MARHLLVRLLLAFGMMLAALPFAMAETKEQTVPPANTSGSAGEALRDMHLASQVHAIFKEKCYDCHGAHLIKPDGGFGYTLDFEKLRSTPDYIVPGDVNKSYIYDLVDFGDMPPLDSDVAQLTNHEKELVKWWIEAGAPAMKVVDEPIKIASIAAEKPIDTSDKPKPKLAQATVTTTPSQPGKRWLNFFGQFHPPTTHFPIALLMMAAFAELLFVLSRRDELKSVVRFCIWFGVIGAIFSASLGWAEGAYHLMKPSELWAFNLHRLLGTMVAIWGLLMLIYLEARVRRSACGCRTGLRVLLFVGAILVSITGFLGGLLTFGVDHYTF